MWETLEVVRGVEWCPDRELLCWQELRRKEAQKSGVVPETRYGVFRDTVWVHLPHHPVVTGNRLHLHLAVGKALC